MSETYLSLWRGSVPIPLSRAATMAEIVADVARRAGVSPELIRTPHRRQKVVRNARQEAMARCYSGGRSNGQVALYFGLKDHTPVIHARHQYAKRMGDA